MGKALRALPRAFIVRSGGHRSVESFASQNAHFVFAD